MLGHTYPQRSRTLESGTVFPSSYGRLGAEEAYWMYLDRRNEDASRDASDVELMPHSEYEKKKVCCTIL